MKKAWQSSTKSAKVLYGFVALFTMYLVVRYASGEFLQAFDAAGHVATLRNIAASWPALTSWQPDQLLGLHYGVLYPPLLHWVIAGFGKVVGVEAAITTLLCLSLIALPVSLWWYGVTLRMTKAWLPLFVLGGVTLLATTPDFFGGNITGLFRLGLTTSFMATPLVIASWAMTEKVSRTHSTTWGAALGLLLGVLVWSHLIAAVVAVVYTIVALVAALYRRQQLAAGRLALSVAGATLISMPFAIPFLQSYGRTMGSSSGIVSSLGITIMAVAVVALAGYMAIRRRWAIAVTPIAAAGLFIVIAVFDILLARINAATSLLYAINTYRFQVFMLLLTLTTVALSMSQLPLQRLFVRIRPLPLVGIGCLGLLLLFVVKNPAEPSATRLQYNGGNTLSGRFLEAFSRKDSGYQPYTMQTEILRHNPNAQWAYGLFIESEPNAPFIKSLSMSINPNTSSDTPVFKPEQTIVDTNRREQLLDLFGISHIITLNESADGAIGRWEGSGQTKYYHDVQRKRPALAEVPALPLQPVSDNWEHAVLSWWESPGRLNYLPYNAGEGELSGSTTPVSVSITRWDRKGIELSIGSTVDHVILIKAPYTPRWHIVDEDGKAVPFRQAAPNLLLLSASGHVTLSPSL